FTPFREPDPFSGLHRNAAMIHVDRFICPCHLIPKMGQSVNPGWTSANMYE
ncbi:hypothetical protein DFJ58DRAFT_614269, partial [Suillus subalutaceus]|uniref:uncharacterized protein n=1 Tax=Suillus subalutaceus TaxID=48586 RepID=UPI001B8713E2